MTECGSYFITTSNKIRQKGKEKKIEEKLKEK